MAQVSEDGKWYWDGHNWHPVPTIGGEPAPANTAVDPAVDPTVDLGAGPDSGSADPSTDAGAGHATDVDLGTRIIVDNAALALVHRGRDTAYAFTGILALLVAFTPNVVSALATLCRDDTLDAATGLRAVADALATTATTHPLTVTLTFASALVALVTLRGLLQVRLFSAPWLQAVTATALGCALVQFAGPYLPS